MDKDTEIAMNAALERAYRNFYHGIPVPWGKVTMVELFMAGYLAGMKHDMLSSMTAAEEQGHGKYGINQLLAAVDAVLNDAEEWRGAVVCSDSVAEALYDQGGAIVTEMRMKELAIARRGIGLEGRSSGIGMTEFSTRKSG